VSTKTIAVIHKSKEMYLREVFVLAVAFLVCSQAAVIDRKDPDWVNNLESDKLDDTEIEALSIDDSHTDQDLERELKDIEAKDAAQQKNPSQPTITDVLSRVNEKQAGNSSVEVVEVDIAVGPPSTQDDEIEKKSAIRDLGRIWQDRIVPYVISSAFDKATTDKIKGVMAQYMQKTCLKFVDVTGKTGTVKTYLSIEKLSGCWSYVGRYSGAQTLSIGSGCEYDGVIIHEIMHALGFYHEQSRSDRDDFVDIMW